MKRPPLDDTVRVPPATKPRARYCGGKPPREHTFAWRPYTVGGVRGVWLEECTNCGRRGRMCFDRQSWNPGLYNCLCGHHE